MTEYHVQKGDTIAGVTSRLNTNWYGNKHAFQFGFFQADPLGISNLSLRFEYTAIMPWVYTHNFRINSYTTDSNSLGHWAGPNSEVYYFHLQKDWRQRLTTGFKFQQWKHGANYENDIEVEVDMEKFEALNIPLCPFCDEVARPNILMFGDWSWLSDRSSLQSSRYHKWLNRLQKEKAR
jgi:hypothetical protein